MTWFKVDDRLWGHPKWLATPARSRALWASAGSWCAGQGTDGKVPRHVLPILGGNARDAAALVTAGLWRETRDGWRFHGWDEFQPDAASEKARRSAASDGGAMGNHVRWHVARNITVPSCGYCSGDIAPESGGDRVTDSPPNPPDPTRPDTRSDDGLSSVGGSHSPKSKSSTYVTRESQSLGIGADD